MIEAFCAHCMRRVSYINKVVEVVVYDRTCCRCAKIYWFRGGSWGLRMRYPKHTPEMLAL